MIFVAFDPYLHYSKGMELSALFLAATLQFNLPDGLLESLCFVESSHNIQAVHHDDGDTDSLGVCQVKYKTARWMGYKGDEKGLMKPSTNIYFAAKYLAHQRKRYKGDLAKAIIAYNQGSARSLTQTSYSRKVFSKWEALKTNDRRNTRPRYYPSKYAANRP